jgi:hypothetical protein
LNNADTVAEGMKARGVSQELINAYIFKEYANAAASEKFGKNLIGSAQFLGDYFTDPTRVGGNTVRGGVQAVGNMLMDDTAALEYLRRGRDGVVAFSNADIRSQATTVGNGAGNVATAAVEVAVGYGAGRLAGAARGAGAGAGTALDEAAAINRAALDAMSPGGNAGTVRGAPTTATPTATPAPPTNVTVTFENAGARLPDSVANQGWRTAGTNVDATDTSAGRQMIANIEATGVPRNDAILYANNYFASGSRPPVAVPIRTGDTLVKIVPAGQPVTPTSGYFMTQSEFARLSSNPLQLADRLGLPPSSQALQYDIYQITAQTNTTVFRSPVAPTINARTGARQTGGAQQTIVANRTQFSTPVRTGTINAYNPLPPRGN